ncbi:hypothetical protein BDP27DRAFT_998612 [Rhodocollybia butyracea]|uniref:Uncharacterized protein n=1 Tax=Rhodocollybia butyracea TaxID=206335 RepID=A0A9P5PP02_9AGAR|nr:hypothetical protein BDP27DRAFT_998612 [Rhodocollybia butyracea]
MVHLLFLMPVATVNDWLHLLNSVRCFSVLWIHASFLKFESLFMFDGTFFENCAASSTLSLYSGLYIIKDLGIQGDFWYESEELVCWSNSNLSF